VQGWFVLDRHIAVGEDGSVALDPAAEEPLARVVTQFSAALAAATPPPVHSPAPDPASAPDSASALDPALDPDPEEAVRDRSAAVLR